MNYPCANCGVIHEGACEHEKHVFKKGDRGYSHYTCKWGTVAEDQKGTEGFDAWFHVRNDDDTRDLLNPERFVTPEVAKRYGYGTDPRKEEG